MPENHEIEAHFVVKANAAIEKHLAGVQAELDRNEQEIVRAMRDAIAATPVCSDQATTEARKIYMAFVAMNMAGARIQARQVDVSPESVAVAAHEQMTKTENAAQIEAAMAETQLYGSSVRRLTNDDGKLIVSELTPEEQAAFDRSIQEADIAEKLASASPLDAEGSRKGKVSKLDGQGVTGEVSTLDAALHDPAAAARAAIIGTDKD